MALIRRSLAGFKNTLFTQIHQINVVSSWVNAFKFDGKGLAGIFHPILPWPDFHAAHFSFEPLHSMSIELS